VRPEDVVDPLFGSYMSGFLGKLANGACWIFGMNLIRSKDRVADHGEVFTPPWMVDAMLDLVRGETERIDSRFLEPACGSGNFLVKILKRKLDAVDLKFKSSEFERRHFALLGLMSAYGIELLPDNISECSNNMLGVFGEHLGLSASDELLSAGRHVLAQNLVHGDALTMLTVAGSPIIFAEWGYLGRGKYQRRDFRLDVLTQASSFTAEGSLFAELGRHQIFTPVKTYPPQGVADLAAGGLAT